MHKKPDNFLKIPEYPGGKTALVKFIEENRVYPEKAKEAGIEGIVFLIAEIDDNGRIGEVVVEKGLGYGCDEEAVRVVKLLKFGAVKNRGKRLKTKKKFRIAFRPEKQKQPPPAKKISFSIKSNVKKEEAPKEKTYNYTITVKK